MFSSPEIWKYVTLKKYEKGINVDETLAQELKKISEDLDFDLEKYL